MQKNKNVGKNKRVTIFQKLILFSSLVKSGLSFTPNKSKGIDVLKLWKPTI